MSCFEKEQAILNTFTKDFKSLMIASLTRDGKPFASYAPFVQYEGTYYFLISQVAKHYENLKHHPYAQILMLEDESKANHIFFRKRLSYDVKTSFVSNDKVKQAFIQTFGDFVKQLFMMDFVIVACDIQHGQMVLGPGKAYVIDEMQHITSQVMGNHGKGHQIDQ